MSPCVGRKVRHMDVPKTLDEAIAMFQNNGVILPTLQAWREAFLTFDGSAASTLQLRHHAEVAIATIEGEFPLGGGYDLGPLKLAAEQQLDELLAELALR